MRDDLEHDRLESTWDRWQQLPLGYRVNAGLYVLGFISLVVLLAQVVSGTGSKPRQVEVASRAPTTTHTTLRATTTSTTKAPPTTAAATTAAPAAPAPPRAASGTSGGSTRASTVDTDPIQGFPPPPTCRDSSDPACGTFSWDPPAGNNLPISISATAAPATAGVGETITFTVNVSDGDHVVSDNCAVINFGDGLSESAPCQPINCPATFGPWNTPGRFPGSNTFTYSHAYTSAGTFTPTFEFHTDRDRCPDPYGNFGRGSTTVTVSPPAPPAP